VFVIVCSRECGTKVAVKLREIAVSVTVRVYDDYQSSECSMGDNNTALERAVVPAVLECALESN